MNIRAMPRPTRLQRWPAAAVGFTKRRPDGVVWLSFLILAIICFWNLNGISFLVLRQGQIFSIVMLICGLLILARAAGNVVGAMTPVMWSFLIFMTVYMGVGAIGNLEPRYLITFSNGIFLVVCSAVATRALVPRIGLSRFLGVTAGIVCLGAWTIFLSPLLFGYYRTSGNAEMASNAGRFLGFFTNPNDAGMNADLAAVTCFACLTLPRKKNALLIIAISITGFATVLTFCRGALVTLAGVGIGYLALTAQLGKRGVGLLFAGVILLGVSYWFFTNGYHQFDWTTQQLRRIESMERIMTFQVVDESDMGGRLVGAQGGLEYWLKSPWMGHGLGRLHAMPDKYFGGLGCHNMHVTVLGESGILGGFCYLVFLLMWAAKAWFCRQQTIRAFCLGLVFVYLFIGMVSHGILDQRSMNMLMGISFGLLSLEDFVLASHGPEFRSSQNEWKNARYQR